MKWMILTVLAALPAEAQTALTPEQFEQLVEGRTLDFGYDGQKPYGLERYMPGRKVFWSWGGTTCEPGYWYPEDGNICFKYDFDPVAQCWRYFQSDGKLLAVFMNDDEGTAVYELQPVGRDLVCDNFGS